MLYLSMPGAERRAEKARLRHLATEAEVGKQELREAVDRLVRGYRGLMEAGASKAFLDDALRSLRDEVSNVDHALNVTIDEAGEWFDPVDLAELDELRAKVTP